MTCLMKRRNANAAARLTELELHRLTETTFEASYDHTAATKVVDGLEDKITRVTLKLTATDVCGYSDG
jgi:hypothetical protein